MYSRIKGLKVEDVECDEVWSFIGMKQKTANKKDVNDPTIGDAWTYTAIERNTKLILCWHLGQRTMHDTVQFTEKLAHATEGNFQVTTDGFAAYKDAVVYSLGAQHVDFAQLIKIYQNNPENETRYSPAKCIGTKKKRVFGRPYRDRVSTSIVERSNLSVRMENRRFTRLTNAFSKRWANHHAALALYFAHYNFCRMHKTLRTTPAMAAGVVDHLWDLKDLLEAATAM